MEGEKQNGQEYVYHNPRDVAEKVLELVRRYNVMLPEQAAVFFPGEEKSVFRAIKKLEKDRQIIRNPYTGLLALNDFAYSMKDEGTIQALWVLADMMGKREVEGHFLAQKEDYPARIVFFGSQEIYDILYIGAGDVKLVNGLYGKLRRPEGKHIVTVEDKGLMDQIEIPDAIGFCLVKEHGEVEYYRKK